MALEDDLNRNHKRESLRITLIDSCFARHFLTNEQQQDKHSSKDSGGLLVALKDKVNLRALQESLKMTTMN